MGSFFAALTTVGVMLFYAVPGFLLVKSKLVASDGISAFAKLRMYVCSPMLVIYSFLNIEFSWALVGKMFIAFVFAISVMLLFVIIFSRVFKGKPDAKYKIYTLATVFPNCAFMGVPILQAVLPEYPEALAFSVMFSMALNISAWTVGFRNVQKALLMALITPDLTALQNADNWTELMVIQEELKTMPVGEIWTEYCRQCGAPADGEWFADVKQYEAEVLSKRG